MSTIPINKGQFALDTKEREEAFERNRAFGVEQEYRENRRLWTALPTTQTVSEFPTHVDIELASVCNLRCPMCYTITDEFKQKVNAKLMPYSLFKKIVDECAAGNVYSIRLSFRGESFLHKNIVDCVKYAKEKGIKEVSSLTNGLRLDEAMFTEIMNAGLDWLTISFDGLGEVYEKIRHPAKYERAIEKLKHYKEIKEKAGRVKPVIKVQSVLPAIEKDPKAYYDALAPVTDLVAANPLIDFHQDVSKLPKIPDFVCPQIYQRLVIGADGTVMMCMNDTENTLPIGNANTQTIHEIWHGPEMTKVREIHSQHAGCAKLKPCSQCNLPLQTFEESIKIGEHEVVAEKYINGVQKVAELNTPERHRRDGLAV